MYCLYVILYVCNSEFKIEFSVYLITVHTHTHGAHAHAHAHTHTQDIYNLWTKEIVNFEDSNIRYCRMRLCIINKRASKIKKESQIEPMMK